MRKRFGVAAQFLGLGVLVLGLAGSCNKPDEGMTARLLEANSKVVACQKELAMAKAERDNLKKQLAVAMANPTNVRLTDPEIIELIADARKARGAGPEF